ncbi:uncharacterized protein F4812DRAFT_368287 [Daldinia caldariorum]|uniref:uncharacterized protein n=1 Tax=Daldinia caldariorum TaxID=326644 RepID=UPI00200750AD|nr:uncharacterized protein F4812DRAFT_368287 [Daldinia caldariorum]KAI1468427.1 hypothetical protein F4812DRAFT_368287 [Daldinia caldariorum]
MTSVVLGLCSFTQFTSVPLLRIIISIIAHCSTSQFKGERKETLRYILSKYLPNLQAIGTLCTHPMWFFAYPTYISSCTLGSRSTTSSSRTTVTQSGYEPR